MIATRQFVMEGVWVVGQQNADIADTLQLRDITVATIFVFLYMGWTLAPPGEYDWTMCVLQWCGLMSSYFDHLLKNTTTVLRPFVWDYLGKPVPEETFTHTPTWSSSNLYQLLPSATIHSILHVQNTCLVIFLHNLSPHIGVGTVVPVHLYCAVHVHIKVAVA